VVQMNDAELTHEALAVMNGSRLDGAAITVKLNDNPNSNPNPRERADRGQRERPAAKVTSPLHPPLLVLPPRVRCAPELSAISAHARVCLPLPPQVVPDSTRLFVTGLHPGVDWSALKDHFKYIGPVQYCDVYTYKDASHAGRDMLGKSKGCGVVQMMDARAAMEAMQELNGSTLMGQAIAVKQDTHAAAFVPSYDDYGDARPPQRDAAYDRGDRNERPPREQQYGARGGGGDWDNERPPREQQYGARGGGGDWDNERRPRERSGGDRWDNDRRRATGRDERSGGGGGGWDNDGAERSPRERSMDGMERGNAGWRAPQDRSRVTGDRERTEYVQKPGDWQCADCGAMCFASRRECFKCRAPR
jgi:hypothetical protein